MSDGQQNLIFDQQTSEKGRFDVWVEAHYNWYDDNLGGANRDGEFGVVYVGADYLLTPNFLFGFIGQYDHIQEDSRVTSTEFEGDGWMIGPYASARLAKNLYVDLRFMAGQSYNDIDPSGLGKDSFTTNRKLIHAGLTGSWNFGKWRVTPSTRVIYAEEKAKSYTETVSGLRIRGQRISLGQLKFGPEIAYRKEWGDNTIIETQLSVAGLWNFDHTERIFTNGVLASPEDLRARIEAGVHVLNIGKSDLNLRATITYDGIGSDNYESFGFNIGINIPFD